MVRRPDGEDPTTAQFGGIIESTTPANASEYDVVLLGEPYDGATTGRPEAREGPAAIRAALASVDTHHLDAGPVDSVGDLGTVEIPFGGSVSTAQEAVRETVSDLHAADTIPVLLGGDGSLTYANVVGLLDATAATDGGGYITDGGFGDDEESVGDVEHFDPTAADDEETDSEDSGEHGADTDEEDDSVETPESSEEDAGESTDESGETDADAVEDDAAEDNSSDDDGDTDATDSDGDAAAEDRDDQQDGDDSAEEGAEDSETTDSDDEDGDDSDDAEAEVSESVDEEESADEDEADDEADDADETEEMDDEDDAAEQTGFGTDSGDTETELIDETDAADGAAGSTDDATATASVGVISLAARLDCNQAEEPTARSRHRDLLEAGVDSLAVLGARHFESTTAEAEYLRNRDGTVVTAEEVAEDPVEATDHALDAMADVDQLYVSVDLSVLDPAAAPGVSDPAPGGLSTRELFRVVRLLASDDRLAGLELIEAVPSLDEGGRTVDAAARAVAHAVSTVE